ncbi:hypothetical protein [Tannerella forsythia]|uniref:hypothetical protein n=2 Tax=Tannerella forsythia TaxID=28112 RepID=UPI00211C4C1C|nr:hypothetical protein [Tannerella forsythia]
MRFTRLRDACRSENQVTCFASDSLIFFRPARCSVGSPPEAEGTNAEGVRGEIPHYVRNDKGGRRNDKHSYLRSFAPFAKFAFGYCRHHTKKGRTQGSPLH